VPVKGLADPVEVYEVMGAGPARTRLQAGAQRGLTRFVGRDAELEQLRRAQQLAANSHGQVAAIVGEAGVGKSRLVYELTHSHRLQGWLVLESASVSYGKATSYLPVIDLLKGYFKIQDRDDLREIREKVTGKLLTLDEALKPALPALLALLDVPVDDAAWQALDPGQRRQRTLDAVKRLLLREAREQPLLVIVEDLHWIDGETLHLLKGDWAKARLLIEHGISVVRTGNVGLLLPRMVASSAWGLAQLGEASAALNRLREGEQLFERQAARGYVSIRGWTYHLLGRAALLLVRLDEARRLADRAVESSPRQPGFAAYAQHLLGDIATHPERFDAESGEAHYRQALALAEPRGMRPLVAHCHFGLGKLYRRTGKREAAQEHLTTATTMYREMDMGFWLEQAETESTELGA
jgi:tetratricopeptide (TPR) repeat protein